MRPPVVREGAFQSMVIDLAVWLGWPRDLVFHPRVMWSSRRGYPDLTLVNPTQRRLLWLELKAARTKITPAQQYWVQAIREAGGEAYIWRDGETTTDEMVAVLKGTA